MHHIFFNCYQLCKIFVSPVPTEIRHHGNKRKMYCSNTWATFDAASLVTTFQLDYKFDRRFYKVWFTYKNDFINIYIKYILPMPVLVLPTIVFIFSYTYIYIAVLKQRRRIGDAENSDERYIKSAFRSAKKLLVICLVFLLTYMPFKSF